MTARLGLVAIVGAPVLAIGIASYVVFVRADADAPAATLTRIARPEPEAPSGSPVEQHVRAQLQSSKLHEQARAVEQLAYLASPKTAPLLYLALGLSPALRIKAANALGDMRLRAAIPKLREALAKTREPEDEVQVAAALYRLGDREARTQLNTATLHANTRIFAALALAEAGDELGRKTLVKILETEPKGRDYWRMATIGMAQLGDPAAITTLERELGHADPARSLAAATAFARIGNSKGLDRLVQFVDDLELDHPAEAALALAHLGDRRALHWVSTGLASPDIGERRAAIGVATSLGASEHAAAIAKLAATDPDADIRDLATVASLAF